MKLSITSANKIDNPIQGYAFAFIDEEDKKLKIKKHDSIIEFSNDLSDVQLLDLTDYTAFEVFPTSKEYAPGEYVISYNGYSNSITIPAVDTHHFIIRSIYTLAQQNVVIDWGDGTVTDIKNSEDVKEYGVPGSQEFIVKHKYTELDRHYIVKIYGNTYFGIMGENSTKYIDDGSGDAKCYLKHNLITRIFDKDLPVASCITNAASMCRYAKRLVYVNVYGHSILRQVTNWTLCFSACENLYSAWGFQDDNLNVSACSEMFANCKSMVKTDFRIPRAPRSSSVANSIFKECNNLSCNVDDLLETSDFMVSPYKIGSMFYNTKVAITEDTVESVAAKLWNNPNIEFTTTTNCFKKCSAETKAFVPASWGGTASNDIIKDTTTFNISNKITDLNVDTLYKADTQLMVSAQCLPNEYDAIITIRVYENAEQHDEKPDGGYICYRGFMGKEHPTTHAVVNALVPKGHFYKIEVAHDNILDSAYAIPFNL